MERAVFRSASDRWLYPTVSQTFAADGTVTRKEMIRRSTQPETWDKMIKERDGAESGARVEMWTSEEEGVWEKVEGEYNTDLEEKEEKGDGDSEAEDEPGKDLAHSCSSEVLSLGRPGDDKTPSIEVGIRRGREAQYVQDGRPVNEHQQSRKLREIFEKPGWKEIKARGLFISGAENDPWAHL